MDSARAVPFGTADTFLLLLITVVSFSVRYWNIFWPNGCVFDEVYFGNFTNYYTLQEFYYDIHPPLAKVIAFVFAHMAEYNASINFQDSHIYKYDDYVMLRITPATFSALCAPLAYLAVRFAGFGMAAGCCAACLIMFDTSLGTEGRHILSDGILHFFSMLHVVVLMRTLALPRHGRRFAMWYLACALSLGAACSCKNTAWGLMAMDGLCIALSALPILRIGVLDYIAELAIYGVPLFAVQLLVYLIVFSIHFVLLPHNGPGDGYLSSSMRAQLVPGIEGFALRGYALRGPGLFLRSIKLTMDMHRGNMGIQQFHDSMSFPSQWPLLTGIATFFWSRDGMEVRCLGNVFSYYFVFAGVVVAAIAFWRPKYANALRFVIGWAVCYFPFFLIPRIMYQYHYCIPLMIGAMAAGAALEMFVPQRFRWAVFVIICALTVFGFWLWSPFMYGSTPHDRKWTIWTKLWIDGNEAHQKRRQEYYDKKENR